MTGYLIRRLAALIPTLLVVSMLAFGITELAGGDPAREAAEQGEDLAPERGRSRHKVGQEDGNEDLFGRPFGSF